MSSHVVSEQGAVLHSSVAELSVLGGMYLEADAIEQAAAVLAEADFSSLRHQKIFRAIVAVHERGDAVDTVTLAQQLQDAGDFETIGGNAFLAKLLDAVPTATNVGYHVGIVRRFSALRRMQGAAREALGAVAGAGDRSEEEVYADVERIVASAAPAVRGSPLVRARSDLWPVMEGFEALGDKTKDRRVYTGIHSVDRMVLGFRRGDLIVLAGRPSMGKSAAGVCNIAADAAIRQGLRVALFSAETKRHDVISRLLASEARVNLYAARQRGGLRDDDYPRMADAAGLLNTAELYIDDQARTIDAMRAKLRQLRRESGPIDVIEVDYLQMFHAPQFGTDRTREVGYISNQLKEIAGEFDAAVIALSQLSRAVEARPDKRPMMSDLRDSGSIEQDADVVGLLYRPEYYFGPTMSAGRGKDKATVSVEGKAEWIFGKVRDGQTGTVDLAYRKEFTLFEDYPGG